MIKSDIIQIEDLIEKNDLVVPSYQRSYDWKLSEIEEFWNDLEMHYNDKSKRKNNQSSDGTNLFLGTIILYKANDSVYEIVDGQQRITSIFILLIALRSKLSEWIEKKIEVQGYNFSKIRDKFSEYIAYTDSSTGMFESTKLKASKKIANTIEYMCHDNWDGNFLDEYNGINTKKETKIIKPIFEFLCKQLQGIEPKKFKYFMKAILHTKIIRIEINDMEEAFALFERTNARGKDLEVSDLLKNHLFMNWNKKSNLVLEEEWDEISSNSQNQLIRMLKYFYVSQNGYITKSKLYKGFKDLSKEKNVEKLLIDIKRFSEFFDVFMNCDKQKFLEYFLNITLKKNGTYCVDELQIHKIRKSIVGINFFRVTQCYPLIYSFINAFRSLNLSEDYDRKHKVLLNFFLLLENYHFINNFICDRVGNEIEKLYANTCKKFALAKDKKSFLSTYVELFSELKKKLAGREEFTERFTQLNYLDDNTSDFMYIFDKIENTNSKKDVSDAYEFFDIKNPTLRKRYNLEHWLPQNPSQSHNNEMSFVIHNIGNLLVIPSRTNIKLGNKLPKEKFDFLSNDEFYSMPHIKEFFLKYEKNFDNWNKEVIEQRAEELAINSYNRVWNFYVPSY